MREKIIVLTIACLLAFSGVAFAQKIQTLSVFPYQMGEVDVPLYPTDIEQLCTTDIVESICEVNPEGGTLVIKDVPYSGSVEYSGNVSGEVGYAGEVPFSGSVPVTASGLVPFETYIKEGTGSFTYAINAPACTPESDKACCSVKGNPEDGSVTIVCQKVDPANVMGDGVFTYDMCSETTAQVPWTYEGSASFSGSAPFSGMVAYNAPYAGSVNYSGTAQTEVKEFSADDVIYNEGNVVIDCPEQSDVPTQTVLFKELVTKAYVGDTINVEATGYSYIGAKTLRQRIAVSYKATPRSKWVGVTATEKEIFQSEAGGLFKDYMETFKFEKAGIYRFLFKVWKKTSDGWKVVGKIQARTVTVVEPTVQ